MVTGCPLDTAAAVLVLAISPSLVASYLGDFLLLLSCEEVSLLSSSDSSKGSFLIFASCLACAKGLVENCLRAVGCVKRGCTGCSCSGGCRLGQAGVKGRAETFCPGKGGRCHDRRATG